MLAETSAVIVVACGILMLGVVIGKCIKFGLNDSPEHVNQQDWERVTRHVPHQPGFARRK